MFCVFACPLSDIVSHCFIQANFKLIAFFPQSVWVLGRHTWSQETMPSERWNFKIKSNTIADLKRMFFLNHKEGWDTLFLGEGCHNDAIIRISRREKQIETRIYSFTRGADVKNREDRNSEEPRP